VTAQRVQNPIHTKTTRRALRHALTPAEAQLWKYLQRSQFEGRKFRRQHGVGAYIVDFYCPAEALVVELDGAVHDHAEASRRDETRTRFSRRRPCACYGLRIGTC